MNRAGMISIFTAMTIALTMGCGGNQGDSPGAASGGETPKKQTHISSMRLFKAYETDKAGADKKYKGRTLKVTGLVEKKGEWLGQPYLALIGSGKKGAMFGYVRCYAPKAKVDALQAGRVVTVQGLGGGKRVDVELKNCRVIK